ncbi:hypothetical protein BS50DRAFT_202564 [Corynespora cassiicola Philippines]|uniref:Uncharacterized protein n=1 Tax=Corynespora cassiicola Philippines TaxID=1448308 RepID=A0A2T2N522_CORCC|nr:hypothetical protein BS50DRAFT_202564 [Corynespora cassiicola Philippines]
MHLTGLFAPTFPGCHLYKRKPKPKAKREKKTKCTQLRYRHACCQRRQAPLRANPIHRVSLVHGPSIFVYFFFLSADVTICPLALFRSRCDVISTGNRVKLTSGLVSSRACQNCHPCLSPDPITWPPYRTEPLSATKISTRKMSRQSHSTESLGLPSMTVFLSQSEHLGHKAPKEPHCASYDECQSKRDTTRFANKQKNEMRPVPAYA